MFKYVLINCKGACAGANSMSLLVYFFKGFYRITMDHPRSSSTDIFLSPSSSAFSAELSMHNVAPGGVALFAMCTSKYTGTA